VDNSLRKSTRFDRRKDPSNGGRRKVSPATDPTVFIIDDDASIRQLLRLLLESVNLKVEVYESADEFLNNYSPVSAGCLLLDIRMPGMSGLELQKELINKGIDLPCIILTGHADVSMAVNAMKSGIADFIEKPFNNDVLLDTVQRTIGNYVASNQERVEINQIINRFGKLTPREREVLDHLVEGHTNKGIARCLNISEKTVEKHRGKVMDKMVAKSLAALVTMATNLKNSLSEVKEA